MSAQFPLNSWSAEYYEILEFYFWESQHLGKIKNPLSRYSSFEKVLEHVLKMEVSLNHQFNTFFSLLPNSILCELFFAITGKKYSCEFVFSSKATRMLVEEFKSITQPDLLFRSQDSLVCIEMKLQAKTDMEQLMKYLLLSVLEAERSAVEKDFTLIFIGKGEFKDLFKEKFQNMEEAVAAFAEYSIPEFSKNGKIPLSKYEKKLHEVLARTTLVYINYHDFGQLLRDKALDTENEVLKKLYTGLIEELERRGI